MSTFHYRRTKEKKRKKGNLDDGLLQRLGVGIDVSNRLATPNVAEPIDSVEPSVLVSGIINEAERFRRLILPALGERLIESDRGPRPGTGLVVLVVVLPCEGRGR